MNQLARGPLGVSMLRLVWSLIVSCSLSLVCARAGAQAPVPPGNSTDAPGAPLLPAAGQQDISAPTAPVQVVPGAPPAQAVSPTPTAPAASASGAPPVPDAPPAPPVLGLPVLDPRVVAARYELMQIELELTRLRRDRPRLGWPITLVIAGGGMATLSGTIGLALWASSRDQRYRWDEAGNRHRYTEIDEAGRGDARMLAGYTAVGLALASGGIALLVPRVKARRRLNARTLPVRQRRAQLLHDLLYIVPGRAGASATVHF